MLNSLFGKKTDHASRITSEQTPLISRTSLPESGASIKPASPRTTSAATHTQLSNVPRTPSPSPKNVLASTASVTTLAEFTYLLNNTIAPTGIRRPQRSELYVRIPHLPLDDQESAKDAFLKSAAKKIRLGNQFNDVVQSYGITEEKDIYFLKLKAAGHDLGHGASISKTSSKYGMTSPEDLFKLERIATLTGASKAVLSGVDVQTAARKFGISSTLNIDDLNIVASGR